jgi:beta-lactamase superfamily II metal-dependent hydrolase
VVLSIALFLPRFQHTCDELLKTDSLLPQHLVPAWRRILLRALRWIATSIAISAASWIGSLPLTAYYFHLFSPVTLLANVIVVPLSTGALAANLASLITSPWLPGAAELFNHAAWFFMQGMIQVSKISVVIPGAYSYVHAPTIPAIGLFYISVVALLAGKRSISFKWGGAARTLLALTGIFASATLYFWPGPARCATITVLPLSGGFAVHAHHPGLGKDLLVDCGDSEAVQFITTPHLRASGTDHLPALLITHGDVRHMGGACLLANNFRIAKTFASPVRFRSSAYRQALQTLNQSARPVENLWRGLSIGPWSVLHPEPGDRFPRADDNALVLAAEFQGARVVLLSDLGASGQNTLLERYPDLRADIVIAGLPAIGEPLSPALLEQLRPRLIIVADSEFPANERASARLRERLRQTSIPILYTRFEGSSTLQLQPNSWKVRTMQRAARDYASENQASLQPMQSQ